MIYSNNYGKVIFNTDTAVVVPEILKKYDLDENPDEVFEKLDKEELLKSEVILNIVEEIVLGTIPKENLISSIENELKVSREIAEKIADDIKAKLLSETRKATLEEIKETESESPETETSLKPNPLMPIDLTQEGSQSTQKETIFSLPKETIKKIEPKEKDVYREPIE